MLSMLRAGQRWQVEQRRKLEFLNDRKFLTGSRIFEEWNNSGDGSSTSARVYETVAAGAVSKETLWGSDWKTWVDTSY